MRKYLFTLCLVLSLGSLVWADTVGPALAGTGGNDASSGTAAWSNTGNVVASDNVYATVQGANATTTNYLKATNFGLSVPGGATINGITFEVEIKDAGLGNSNVIIRVSVVKGGIIGAQRREGDFPSDLGGTEEAKTYGGSSQLWNETWTSADVNASDFGMVLQVNIDGDFSGVTDTISVDAVRVTITYTVGATTDHTSAQALMIGSGE